MLALYEKGIISRNSLQQKVDLNPEIETARRDQEREQPMDIPDARTIVDMVNAGIMSIETAREKLGLNTEKEQQRQAQAEVEDMDSLYLRALKGGKTE